jgi:hypothetical protein
VCFGGGECKASTTKHTGDDMFQHMPKHIRVLKGSGWGRGVAGGVTGGIGAGGCAEYHIGHWPHDCEPPRRAPKKPAHWV